MFHDKIISTVESNNSEERKLIEDVFGAPKMVPFYYNDEDLDDSLIETGREFLKEGLLNLPYKNCLFVKRENGSDKIAFLVSEADEFDGLKVMHVYSSGMGGGEMVEYRRDNDALSFVRVLPEAGNFSDRELLINAQASMGNVVSALMLMNTKYTDKVKHDISPKLNKNRARKGKEPLAGYTTISLKESISRERGGTHDSPKPHWRRGHIRRLPTGKIIPIQPCMVNFDGTPIDPGKVYNVKGER